ncbi:Uncharacterised protein [Chlamydia trachomatis]|nr:Uncharacterised protein [Chlamydia trachomatis]
MHVAPPENCFDPPSKAQTAVTGQHLTKRGICRPLNAVGHCRHGPIPTGVKESKQSARADQTVKSATGLPAEHAWEPSPHLE